MRKVLTLTLLVVLAGAVAAGAQSRVPGGRVDRVDPPGFGPMPVDSGQTIRIHVFCFPHQVGQLPPDPCRGSMMLHDMDGMVVKSSTYDLRPGEVGTLEYTAPVLDAVGAGEVLIIPCFRPAPGGRAVPTAEVIDRSTGHVALFANPVAAQMTDISNGRGNPGARVGFNPQPDPPGFGAITVSSDQVIRTNVACFNHNVAGFPPGPCRGAVMLHDAAGRTVSSDRYELMPGETATFEFMPMADEARADVLLTPCIEPQPGGRAVPNVTIADAMTGRTSLLVNPAVPAMSDFAR